MRAVCLLTALLCIGGISAELSKKYQQEILDIHNDLRREQHASNMQELEWSDEMAQKADTWIARCNMEHENKGFGENLGFMYLPPGKDDYSDILKNITHSWYDEITRYHYGQSCAQSVSCHYTQVVWYKTREIGCAHKVCPTMTMGSQQVSSKQSLYYGCWYAPRGNWEKYPFVKGAPCSKCTRAGSTCDNGLCLGGQDICEDKDKNCRAYKASGQCQSNPVWMEQNCLASCGCPAGSIEVKGECKDESPNCARFGEKECGRNPTWMNNNCAKMCKQC